MVSVSVTNNRMKSNIVTFIFKQVLRKEAWEAHIKQIKLYIGLQFSEFKKKFVSIIRVIE